MTKLYYNKYVFILYLLVVAIIFAEIYSLFKNLFSIPYWYAALVVNISLSIPIFYLFILKHKPTKTALPILVRFLEKYKYWSFIPSLVILVAVAILIISSSLSGGTQHINPSMNQLYFVLVIPIFEELVFRVGLGSLLQKHLGLFNGVWFSAILFSFMHSNPTIVNVINLNIGLVIGPFLLGLITQLLYSYSGKLMPCITFHMVCNLTAVLFAYFDARWLQWLKIFYIG